MKKKPYRESWDIRICDFGPNWDQILGFSLLVQEIRRSLALSKNLLILSPTTQNSLPTPFISKLLNQNFIPLHLIPISMF